MSEIQRYHWTRDGMKGGCGPSHAEEWVKASALEAQAEGHKDVLRGYRKRWENERAGEFNRLVDRHAADIASLQQEVEDLKEALYPFGLYATALKGREGRNTVLRIGHQSIAVSAFREARETLKLDETPTEEKTQ